MGYLRTEKQKISKQLEKEKINTHKLEEENKDKSSAINGYISKLKSIQEREKSLCSKSEKAIKDKEDAVNQLRSKTKQFKIQQNTFKESQIELENLRKRDEKQRNEKKKMQ